MFSARNLKRDNIYTAKSGFVVYQSLSSKFQSHLCEKDGKFVWGTSEDAKVFPSRIEAEEASKHTPPVSRPGSKVAVTHW